MIQDIPSLVIMSGVFLVLFGLGEIGYRLLKIKAEYTRKFVHAGTGILTLYFPIVFTSHWSVLLICSSFLVILMASWKWNILPSINAIDRFSWGSLLYPVTVYALFYLYLQHGNARIQACDYLPPGYYPSVSFSWFYVPILILAFADPAAALVGKRFQIGKYRVNGSNKTLIGSFSFAVVAFAVSYGILSRFQLDFQLPMIVVAIIIAVATSIVEALSSDGIDNLTIPISAYLLMELLLL